MIGGVSTEVELAIILCSVKQNGQVEVFHNKWFDDTEGTMPAETFSGVLGKADLDKLFALLKKDQFFQLPDIQQEKPASDIKPWQQLTFCSNDGISKQIRGDLGHSKYKKLLEDLRHFFAERQYKMRKKELL